MEHKRGGRQRAGAIAAMMLGLALCACGPDDAEVAAAEPMAGETDVADSSTTASDEGSVDTTGGSGTGAEPVAVDGVEPIEPATSSDADDASAPAEPAAPAEPDAGADGADDPSGEPGTRTADFAIESGECLTGTWMTAPGEFQAYMDAISASTATATMPGIDMDVTGRVIFHFENDYYTYDVKATTTIDIDGFTTSTHVDGIARGPYELDNGFLVAEQDVFDVDAWADFGGERVDAGDFAADLVDTFGGGYHEAPYDCGDEGPTIHFEVAPGAERHPIQFVVWDGVTD